MQIRSYRIADQPAVIRLWSDCGLVRPWNDPVKDIARKLTVQPDLFLVGVLEEAIIASVMDGYDGHRGWLNYLAVSPKHRGRGYGRTLMLHVEQALMDMGCPKLNMQVRASNTGVLAFYRKLGYAQDETVSLGKRLIPDS